MLLFYLLLHLILFALTLLLWSMTMVNVKRMLGCKKCCNCANSIAHRGYEIRKSVAYNKNELNIMYFIQKWWKLLKWGPNERERRIKMKTYCTKVCKRECMTNALLVCGTVNLYSCVAVVETDHNSRDKVTFKYLPWHVVARRCYEIELVSAEAFVFTYKGPQSMGQGPLGGQRLMLLHMKLSAWPTSIIILFHIFFLKNINFGWSFVHVKYKAS